MKTTKVYKVTMYVIDPNHDIIDRAHLRDQLTCNKDLHFMDVTEILEADCGEWNAEHELNRLFPPYDKYFENKKGT